jgi:hypothetical protein
VELRGGDQAFRDRRDSTLSVTVYTCILGGHDNLREPEFTTRGARYVCYSDIPLHRRPWEIQPAYLPYPETSRNSRIPKILSHLHVEDPYSIWLDGCFTPKCDVVSLVRDWLDGCDMAIFRHPARPDIYKEALYCRRDAKNLNFDAALANSIDAQVDRYRREGFPGAPFFAGGIIVRRECEAVWEFNELWWKEYLANGRRDQFSLAYAVWKSGLKVRVIEDGILENRWFGFNFHAAFADAGCNPQFAEERAREERRFRKLKELTC